MNEHDAEEFTQALGQVVAGSWRQVALAKRLGVPKALGLSVDQWVNDRLGGYVKLSISDRREAARELAEEGHSSRAIGEVLGVSQMTAVRDIETNVSPKPEESSGNGIADETNVSALDAVAALAASDDVRAAPGARWGTFNDTGLPIFDKF